MMAAISISLYTFPISTNRRVTFSGLKISSNLKRSLHKTIKSLLKFGKLDEAIRLIEKSPASDLLESEAYSTVLHACISARSFHYAWKLYSLVLESPRLRNDSELQSKLITLFSVCRRIDLAQKIFDDVTGDAVELELVPEQVWVAMAIGYSRNGLPKEALLVYVDMLHNWVEPGNFALSTALKACTELKDFLVGKGIHAQIVKWRERVDQVVDNALLKLYMECGSSDDVGKMFDGMPHRNIVSWNSLIVGLAEKGQVREMLNLFRKMQEKRIGFSWATFTTLLPVCSRIAALLAGKEIHAQILKSKGKPDTPLMNSLMDMYGKCGEFDYSRRIFDGMSSKDLTSWNTMLNCYAINRNMEEAFDLFNWMIESGVMPDGVTFVVLLSGCSDAGLTDYGLKLFDRMKMEFRVSPSFEHYACLVDILGKDGKFDEAIKVIETMPFKPSGSIWGSLLNSCRLHGNVAVAERVAKELFVLEPNNPGNYVILSNIYANARMWDKVDKIRDKMKQRGIKKEAGCSWIQVEDTIYTFVAGGSFAFRNSDGYRKLWKLLTEAMEKAGYVPNTSVVLHDVDEETKANWLCGHSERLATTYALIHTGEGIPIRVTKNLRVCADCHSWMKIVSKITGRVIVLRDTKRFHHFSGGMCSCKDHW